jgi:catechol 2,3-dioxygenase-like lactoylglutathione lyase family enzyme
MKQRLRNKFMPNVATVSGATQAQAPKSSTGRNRSLRLRSQSALAILLFLTISSIPARLRVSEARGTPDVPRCFPLNGTVASVDSVGITVSDLDRAVEFFSKVLTFEKVSEAEVAGPDYERLQGVFGLRIRVARMKLGDEFVELTEYLAPKGRPIPVDSRSNDRWFQHIAIITPDMDRAYDWLRKNKVQQASTGPQTLPDSIKAAAGVRAFYFKDSDGHALEVLQFPQDKGAEKWHQPSDKLFLGIDHTAIVVNDTDESLKFYREALGFKVAGESENFGTEQEHLNNVFGARLHITAIRAASGPGIELLEYLVPHDGRPAPADERANDLIHWQTKLVTADSAGIAGVLLDRKYKFISTGVTTLRDKSLGFVRGFLVCDPDGHVMELVEK